MSDSYTLIKGSVPLLISMPHNGEAIPEDIALLMTETGKKVPDTDWYKDRLYDFAKSLGAYILMPKYSRYVIDLNRDPEGVDLYPGANSTELCPTSSFDLSPLYIENQGPDKKEIERRVSLYWQPYHQAISDTLAEIKEKFSTAVLLEAHSILSHVPRFFEGQLPDFNFGSANGTSCAPELLKALEQLNYSPYSMISNGRFKGGYITRAYGCPEQNIHAVQLELSQRTYMDEPSNHYNEVLAAEVKPKLQAIVQCLINFTA
jgi:N-formylglutamate deformylase